MSDIIEIPVELRETQGKGASRRLRRQDLVPGIVYGGDRAPQAIQVSQFFLKKALADEAFYTSILKISAGGKAQKVILRDLQRHPVKPMVMHIDFQRIDENEALRMSVPIHFINEEASPAGKKAAVVVSKQINEIEVSCLPGDLPEYIEIDLADLDVGDSIVLRDVTLPEGVTLMAAIAHDEAELDRTVVSAAEVREAAATEDEGETSPDVPTVSDEEEDEG